MGCRISKCHSSLENSDKKAGSNGYLLVLWGVLRLACFFAGEASLKLKFNKKYILFALMLGYYTDIIAPIDPINLKFLKGCALLIIRGICAGQFCWVARHGGPFSLSGPFCCCLPKLHCKKGTKYSPVLHY